MAARRRGPERAALRRVLIAVVALGAAIVLEDSAGRVLAVGETFTVDSVADVGDDDPGDGVCRGIGIERCTLRAAIQEADASAGHDSIVFDIVGPGPHRIEPTTPYLLIDDPAGVTIDGYTQPGAAVNTLDVGSNAVLRIELRGQGPAAFDGIDMRTSGNVIRGLALFDFKRHVRMWGPAATGNEVTGSFIGTDTSGTYGHATRTPNANGVAIEQGAAGNAVGKPGNEHRNVISGNADRGIGIFDPGSDGNLIQNNLIGLAPDGATPLSNRGHGIDVNYNASHTTIGGVGEGEGNVISANGLAGVEISHNVAGGITTGNAVLNNLIGTDATGTVSPAGFGNVEHGVNLEGRTGCETTCPPDIAGNEVRGNVIVGSRANVLIWKGAHDNVVADNRIGALRDGVPPPSSAATEWGVLIEHGAFGNLIESNVIAGSTFGVQVRPDNNFPCSPGQSGCPGSAAMWGSDRNRITANSIHAVTSGLGIDLWPVGEPTSQPPADIQGGIGLPDVVEVTLETASVTAPGCDGCTVEVFLTEDDAPSAHGQGRALVGTATTDAAGAATVVFRSPGGDPAPIPGGSFVAATVTDPAGNTSEFSLRRAGPPEPPEEPGGVRGAATAGQRATRCSEGQC